MVLVIEHYLAPSHSSLLPFFSAGLIPFPRISPPAQPRCCLGLGVDVYVVGVFERFIPITC